MAAAKKGLDGVALRQRGGVRSRSVVDAVRTQRTIEVVEVASVSANPANPKWRSEGEGPEFEQLVASVRAKGVLQPLLLVAAESWREANEGLELPVPNATWVALDGNRRLMAAKTGEVAEVPAFIRDDLAGDGVEVLLHANGGRAALTPIDEALAFERLLAQGMTQTFLAKELGVSQATIAKRVALLRLPDSIQVDVASGEIPVNDAVEVSKEDPAILVRAAELRAAATGQKPSIGSAVETGKREAAGEAQMAEAVKLAEELGAKVGEGHYWNHRPALEHVSPDDHEAIRVAAEAGTLLVFPSYSGPTLHVPAAKRTKRTAETELAAARKLRWRFVVEVASKLPDAKEFRSLLVEQYVKGHMDWGIAEKLMAELSMPAVTRWGSELDQMSDKGKEKVAWCVIVGSWERSLRGEYTGLAPGSPARAFYQRLAQVGYAPTEWEQARLDKAAQGEEGTA